jgi:hypothetical protein
MDGTFPGLVDFLRSVDPRIFRDREVGLDIYLSGAWGVLPLALAVAVATVFLLAIFQAIPQRSHSVPVLLVLGLLASGSGALGSYLQYRSHLEGSPPRVLAERPGSRAPANPGETAALLMLPLFLGGATLGGSLAGSLYLALFGGGKAPAKKKGP